MIVTVFGLGFVGLTTALGFCELGHTVYGVDISAERRALIAAGKLPFCEPGLGEALIRHLNIRFYIEDDPAAAIRKSQFIYYCVGTPYGKDGSADLAHLYAAVEQTLRAIDDDAYRVLVTKSTVPPGTSSEHVIPLVEEKGFHPGERVGVANNPEFLREGHCWEDFMGCDRVVLGVSEERSAALLRELYKDIGAPIFTVSLNTGEFIKYLSNTLLATMISFSNEMSLAADAMGNIDVAQAFRILHMDKRWNNCNMTSYVYPGCGYGGYCLPKDTNAFAAQSRIKGYRPAILEEVIRTNDRMPQRICERIARLAGLEQRVGILGLSFKPGSDDVRDTPAAKIIGRLLENGYKHILAYDPVANEKYAQQYDHAVEYAGSMEQLISACDAIVILTAWPEFLNAKTLSGGKPIIDARYML